MLSNLGHDERWSYAGGAAGDQTGTEWQLVGWYSYPWDVMLRYPDPEVRHWMGDQARAAALNNNIGYDQWQRQTFWQNLADSGYDAAKITVKCESDCSAGVLAICKAAGYHFGIDKLKNINQNGYTGNEEAILTAAGFKAYREYRYLASDAYLDNGDVLLNTHNHTAFNVSRGSMCDVDSKADDAKREKGKNEPSYPVNNMGLYYRAHCQDDGDMELVRDGMWAGTKREGKRIEGLWINPPAGVELEVTAHLQGIGDTKTICKHGSAPLIGTIGEGRRIEGISIRCLKNTTGKQIKYQGHRQTYGDTDICKEGEYCGTRGESKRLEAIRIYME